MRAARAVPPVLLLLYGLAFAGAAVGISSPPGYDDHPGQLYRAWHVVHYGFAPWAWNPGWWAGYPELQFYPPGFAYAAALLHHASFGLLSLPGAYLISLWGAYLGPGLAAFALLARVTGNGWCALPGAFVALTLSAGVASGVEGGVRWGMVSARLGWALLPLILLALLRWIEEDGPWPWSVVPLLAALALIHPTHLPAAALAVLGAALSQRSRLRARLSVAVFALALAAAMSAFWTLPLVWRSADTRALAWGSLATGPASQLAQPLPLVLIALAVLAWRPVSAPRYRRTAALLARWPWAVAVAVAADALVAEPLGVRWLPADRIADGGWMALVLAAGLGAGHVVQRLAASRGLPHAAGAGLSVALLVLLGQPGRTLTVWPRPGEWPTTTAVERGLGLTALWKALGARSDGRVLIARSGVPLVHGTAWYRPHSHVTALTPLRAGRPIVHGTFTHPSPIAALVYRGDAGRGAITALAEQLDGIALFGRPYSELSARDFEDIADRLGIGTVVVFDEDLAAREAMAANAALAPGASSPPFLIYERRAAPAIPRETAPGRWTVDLDGGPGDWTSARLAYYPLWRAEQDGRPLAVRRGSLGDLEVELRAAGRPVALTYGAAGPERAGVAVSAGAVLVWLAALPRLRGHRGRRASRDAASAPPKTNTIAE